ncbi:pimeloyl-ACP methyl ester carboxylesterase [Flavobacterium sp. 270]|uniref:alpha/beta hydrolase n=1 Tax=Flavobacterium sp. 270 TaxID=2512114 RepID=UPI00106512E9|nr:alpha/beta hydrolase [Flavobacterium sp. 270]TDW47810.1 pimeloyl-ACP methyl ester carboxylesterase [Flavobacterium sp. 270]
MKTKSSTQFLKYAFSLALLLLVSVSVMAQAKPAVKNIVLVHGAFADGSGFKVLYDILTKKGYNVTVVQNPLSSLEADVAATNDVLDRQDGPTILAGHSYGGSVITEAGNHKNVVALVYIAAFQPDQGESALDWAKKLPPAPENGILPPDAKGNIYYDKAKYHKGFCADLTKGEADFMYASQGAFNIKAIDGKITQAAWKTKPSYGIVATEDKSIVPDTERNMYKRSNTKITEIKASHVVFISHPQEVADIIIKASQEVKK